MIRAELYGLTPKTDPMSISYRMFFFFLDGCITYHVCIWRVGTRMSLVRAVHGRKLNRVPDKEHRLNNASEIDHCCPDRQTDRHKTHCIVKHPIQIPLVCVQLHSPSMDIARRVGRTAFRADGGYAEKHLCLLPDLLEKTSRGDVGTVMGDLELAIGSVVYQLRIPPVDSPTGETYPAALAWTTL